MSIQMNKIQDKIIEEFSKLNDWFDKYEYLINLGKKHKSIDENIKSEENLLSGCQAQVWIKAVIKNEQINYLVDSDSLITRGILSLLLRVVNNQNSEDIINTELYFIDKIGLKSNLSPSRANGLTTIVKHIKLYAEKTNNI